MKVRRVVIVIALMMAAALIHRPALAQQTSNPPVHAADPDEDHSAEAADVPKQLANPIANLVSIPFQFNVRVCGQLFHAVGEVPTSALISTVTKLGSFPSGVSELRADPGAREELADVEWRTHLL